MLFDIRGRRKNVVKVVYAVLALLMGASLFVAVGPFNISELFNSANSSDASGTFIEQAENAEAKLKKNPEDPDLLLAVTKARINAGNTMAAINPETGAPEISPEGRTQLELASDSWSRYLRATDEPKAGGAQAAAPMLFTLAQGSRTGPEAQLNLTAAAEAQEIVAEQRPSLGSLSTLAIYRSYSGDFSGARESKAEAEKYANTKFERENLQNELDQVEKASREFQKQLVELRKEAKQARERGEPVGANPLSENNPLAGE